MLGAGRGAISNTRFSNNIVSFPSSQVLPSHHPLLPLHTVMQASKPVLRSEVYSQKRAI